MQAATGDDGQAPIIRSRPDTEPHGETPPTLPSDVLGHALGFMIYPDVQSALAAGKTFRAEMRQSIKVLNFTTGKQLGHLSSGRVFPNVDEVICLSFAVIDLHLGGSDCYIHRKDKICDDTLHRLVPFLSTFSRLHRVYVGGYVPRLSSTGRYRYGDDILSRSYFYVESRDDGILRTKILSFWSELHQGFERPEIQIIVLRYSDTCIT